MTQHANREIMELGRTQATLALSDLVVYFLRVGTLAFGGPSALAGLATLAVLIVSKKVPEPIGILAPGVLGVLLHGRVG